MCETERWLARAIFGDQRRRDREDARNFTIPSEKKKFTHTRNIISDSIVQKYVRIRALISILKKVIYEYSDIFFINGIFFCRD